MANVITNSAKEVMIGSVSGADLKIALLGQTIFLSADADIKNYGSWINLSAYEITGTGYVAGGVDLSGLSAYSISADQKAYFNGNSIIWPTATISSYGYALYRSTNNLVVSIVQFGDPVPKTSTNGPFSLSWSSNKILQMIG